MKLRTLLRQPIIWLPLTALFWILASEPGRGQQADLSVLEIASPKGTIVVNVPVPIQFTAQNTGEEATVKGEAFVTILREVEGGDPEQVYSEVLNLALDPGESVEITRPDWTPLLEGAHTITIYLFASNEGNFDNNETIESFLVQGKAACTETGPTRTTMRETRSIPNLNEIGITEPETLTIGFTTEGICCWNLNATQVRQQGEGSLTLDQAASQQTTSGVAATYSFHFSHTEQILSPSVFRITFTWNRCDSPEVNGSESVVLLILPEPGKVSLRQKTTAATPEAGRSGDPVNTATGELFIPWSTDLAFGGPAWFSFRRYYGSNLSEEFPTTKNLGKNWTHNYAWQLQQFGEFVTVTMPSGRMVIFEQNGAEWEPRDRYEGTYQLLQTPEGWSFGDSRRPLIRKFDALGRLAQIFDRNGNERFVAYQGDQLIAIIDRINRTLRFNYNGANQISKISDGVREVKYTYQGENLTGITDPEGNNITITYDPSRPGLITGITRPEGNTPYSQTFDTESRVSTQSDAAGNVWNFSYAPGETTITYPDGGEEHHFHSLANELQERNDQLGNSIDVLYDENGRRTAVIDRLGDTTKITYHSPSGNVASITDAEGGTTSYTWKEKITEGLKFYDLTAVSYPDGTGVSIEYDDGGNITRFTDREGNSWNYSYNKWGQILTATTPTGEQREWFYNASAQLDSIVDADQGVRVLKFDKLDRLEEMTSPDGSSVSYTYDLNNNLTQFTDPTGKTIAYEYDRNNRLTSITNKAGKVTRLTYDNQDRPKSIVDPAGVRSERIYSEKGELVGIVNGSNDTTHFEYDREGRLTDIVDAEGNRLRRELDPEGVLRTLIDQLGNEWNVETDKIGRITKATDPLGSSGEITYDALGRVTKQTDGLGSEQQFSYDERGLLTGWDYPGDITTAYQYSPLGYLTRLTDPLGSQWSYEQDEEGKLVRKEDPLGNETGYEYDALNRLSKITLPGNLGSAAFQRDVRGLVTKLDYSDGTSRAFNYDEESRVVSGEEFEATYDDAGRISSTNGLAVERNSNGQISKVDLASGKSVSYQYDRRGFLTSVTDWLGGNTRFTYSATGSLLSITRPNGLTTNYEYDAAGRLTRIAEPGNANINLTLDALGNVLSAERTGYLSPRLSDDSVDFTYNAGSQVDEFSYDPLGRITDDGNRTYSWNLASQLEEVLEAGVGTTYRYDAFGNVVERERDGMRTQFIWNYALGIPSISVDLDPQGEADRYYVHTPSGYLLYGVDVNGNGRHFYHYDETGNTMMLSNDAGEITDRYAFTPYGRTVGYEGGTDNRYTFAGAWGVMQESGSGLYRMRARLYDASTTRFISRDPKQLMHPKQMNPYRYAMGNPLRYVDITGAVEGEVANQLGDIRTSGGDEFTFLAKLLYGTSTPPKSNVSSSLDDISEPFDEEDPIELGDGEHVFGSGDIGVVIGLAKRVKQKEEEPISDVIVDPASPSSGPLSIAELAKATRERAKLDDIIEDVTYEVFQEFLKSSPSHPMQPRIYVLSLPKANDDMQTFLGVPFLPGNVLINPPPLTLDDDEPERPDRPERKREAPEKMVPHPIFGIPVPASSIGPPPPLTLDDPVDEPFVEEDPIELGDGERVL